MRAHRTLSVLAAVAAISIAALLGSACNDSDAVTAPGPMAASANVSGQWEGDFASNNPQLCTAAAATASFSQQGTRVMGTIKAPSCGINGSFHGFVDGERLTGNVDMMGCTGGAVSAVITDRGLRFEIGDFQKPLVTGGEDVYPGGTAQLSRR